MSCGCGICADCAGGGIAALAPARWRHSALRERLLGRIGRIALDGARPLAGLGTRALDDPAIALIDAFAGGLHVLAWNAARLADDATLARGGDRQALADLVALIGYAPRPALSATTLLAFAVDAFPGSPEIVTIPAGDRVASVPRPGEAPVSFETEEALEARAAWNRLDPWLAQVRPKVTKGARALTVAGVGGSAKVGDVVLARNEGGGEPWLMGVIAAVERDPAARPPRTRIALASFEETPGVPPRPEDDDQVIVLAVRAAAFGAAAPDPSLLPQAEGRPGLPAIGVLVAGTILHDPHEWSDLEMWPDREMPAVDLEGVVAAAMPGRLALFRDGENRSVARIRSAAPAARKDFGLAGKTTKIGLDGDLAAYRTRVRQTAIIVEATRETLLRLDRDKDDLQRAAAEEDTAEPARDLLKVKGHHRLPPGRLLVLAGTAAGGPAAEALTLKSSAVGETNGVAWTDLRFTAPVGLRLRSLGAAVLANVARASQGESAAAGPEPLGVADARTENPRFALARAPVSEVPAATARGYAPALEVRLGGQLCDLADDLDAPPARAPVFAFSERGDGKAEIRFAGRLTSGRPVTALYRAGAGAAGNLEAGRLTTALTPVAGVRSVVNPVPADGGADREPIAAMRVAAPRAVRTLGRVVSLEDYEAFAVAYRGVGKASAMEMRLGGRRVAALTVATASLLPPDADLKTALLRALRAVSPPGRDVRVLGFRPLAPTLAIALAVDPQFPRADVETRVRRRLGEAFGAPARRFGEGLARSSVLAVVQGVEGVVGAVVTRFEMIGAPPDAERLLCPGPGAALDPVTGVAAFVEAGLLTIDPAAVILREAVA